MIPICNRCRWWDFEIEVIVPKNGVMYPNFIDLCIQNQPQLMVVVAIEDCSYFEEIK